MPKNLCWKISKSGKKDGKIGVGSGIGSGIGSGNGSGKLDSLDTPNNNDAILTLFLSIAMTSFLMFFSIAMTSLLLLFVIAMASFLPRAWTGEILRSSQKDDSFVNDLSGRISGQNIFIPEIYEKVALVRCEEVECNTRPD